MRIDIDHFIYSILLISILNLLVSKDDNLDNNNHNNNISLEEEENDS